jgi:hypothetical protein
MSFILFGQMELAFRNQTIKMSAIVKTTADAVKLVTLLLPHLVHKPQ